MKTPLVALFTGAVALLAPAGLHAQDTVNIHSSVDSPVVVISAEEAGRRQAVRRAQMENAQRRQEEENVFLKKSYRLVLGVLEAQGGAARAETTLLTSRGRFHQQVTLAGNGRQDISLNGFLQETTEGRLTLDYTLATTLTPAPKGGFSGSMSSRANTYTRRESQSGRVFLSPGGAEQIICSNGELTYFLQALPVETAPVAAGEPKDPGQNYRVTLEITSDDKTTPVAIIGAGSRFSAFLENGEGTFTGTLQSWENGTLGMKYFVGSSEVSFSSFARLKPGEAQTVFTGANQRHVLRVEVLDAALQVTPQGETRPPEKNYLMTLTRTQKGKHQKITAVVAGKQTNAQAAFEDGESLTLSVPSFLVWENDQAVLSYEIQSPLQSRETVSIKGVLRMKPGVGYPVYKAGDTGYELLLTPVP